MLRIEQPRVRQSPSSGVSSARQGKRLSRLTHGLELVDSRGRCQTRQRCCQTCRTGRWRRATSWLSIGLGEEGKTKVLERKVGSGQFVEPRFDGRSRVLWVEFKVRHQCQHELSSTSTTLRIIVNSASHQCQQTLLISVNNISGSENHVYTSSRFGVSLRGRKLIGGGDCHRTNSSARQTHV